ncbi:MAG: cysteine synthase A [Thermoplasmata archaeon]
MKVYDDVSELIGHTPLVRLDKIDRGLKGNILAKLEYFNPMGSIKDRIALAMIEDAEKSGELKEGDTIVEPTSGNTGIGLSFVSSIKRYDLILTMPENMSEERKKILRMLGAKLVLTDEKDGMKGAIKKAKKLVEENDDHIMLDQFKNPANPEAHRRTTAEETWDDMDGNIDALVAGIGTGGTITGTGENLKGKNPDIQIIGVEPSGSPVLSKGKSGPHKIQGIGAGFVPDVLNLDVLDELIVVEDEDAFQMCRILAGKEGILAGISSGAALHTAVQVAKRDDYYGKNIVVIFPDSGERYLSTELFDKV